MGRTKYEIEAIADAIYGEITKEQTKRIKAVRKKVEEVFNKEYKPLLKEADNLERKAETIRKKIKAQVYGSQTSWKSAVEVNIKEQLAKDLAKVTIVSKERVEREVILAGDSSSDVLIKNIVKMFV